MQFFKKTFLFIFIISFFAVSFTTTAKNQRTIEGRVMNKVTNQPISTEITICRQGKVWSVKSTDNGWYSISLPSDQAYAVKIYNTQFKKHISAFYLKFHNTNIVYEHDIMLLPTSKTTE